jgi:AraC-like DNA-binding protein
LIETLNYIGIVQAFVTGLVLLSIQRKGKFKFLAILLLCLTFTLVNETFSDYNGTEFHFLYHFKFFLLLPNLVYLHVCSKIEGGVSSRILLINLLAAAVEFLSLCLIILLVNGGLINENGDFLYYFHEWYTYITIVYAVLMQVIILRKIALYNGHLFKFFSTVSYKYLNWLKWVCVIFILKEFYYILFYIFSVDVETDDFFYSFYVVLELVLIFYIGIGALLQVNLNVELNTYATIHPKREDKIAKENKEVFEKIQSFMKLNKPFLLPELNLSGLAQMMGVSERQISNAINKSTETNFYTYINLWRVQEVIIMLEDRAFEKYNIAGIGDLAGFNSKSSFYDNFKKVTGFTPSQYLDKLS